MRGGREVRNRESVMFYSIVTSWGMWNNFSTWVTCRRAGEGGAGAGPWPLCHA